MRDLEGRPLAQRTLSVNQPLRFGGVTAYQTDWSMAALTVRAKGSPLQPSDGSPFNLPMASLAGKPGAWSQPRICDFTNPSDMCVHTPWKPAHTCHWIAGPAGSCICTWLAGWVGRTALPPCMQHGHVCQQCGMLSFSCAKGVGAGGGAGCAIAQKDRSALMLQLPAFHSPGMGGAGRATRPTARAAPCTPGSGWRHPTPHPIWDAPALRTLSFLTNLSRSQAEPLPVSPLAGSDGKLYATFIPSADRSEGDRPQGVSVLAQDLQVRWLLVAKGWWCV